MHLRYKIKKNEIPLNSPSVFYSYLKTIYENFPFHQFNLYRTGSATYHNN